MDGKIKAKLEVAGLAAQQRQHKDGQTRNGKSGDTSSSWGKRFSLSELIDEGDDVKAVSHTSGQGSPGPSSVICSVRQLGLVEKGGAFCELERRALCEGIPERIVRHRGLPKVQSLGPVCLKETASSTVYKLRKLEEGKLKVSREQRTTLQLPMHRRQENTSSSSAVVAPSTPWLALAWCAGLETPEPLEHRQSATPLTKRKFFLSSVVFRHASRLAVLAFLPSGTERIIQAAILLFLALGRPRRQRVASYSSIAIGRGSPDLPSGIAGPAANQWERARTWRALSCWRQEGIGQAKTQAPVHAGQRVSVSAVQPRAAAKPKESTPVMSGSVLSLVCRAGQAWSRDGKLGPGPRLFGPASVPVAGGVGPTGDGLLAPAFSLRPGGLCLLHMPSITHIGK
ncbi:hypothetical protein QBC40DRAFT_351204 [Triangularia verruculosa]|uniref:Uncharacterized protein n=1 Tax=Triangularia verruculosa TaxID=2587418 RepID=A0AAN6XAN6_9PEZI|nr:hypothetical protein QBC40DRAFT_351204 [Triangularia verruculosa]